MVNELEASTDKLLIVAFVEPPITNAGESDNKVTFSKEVGDAVDDQFVPVAQSEFVVPLNKLIFDTIFEVDQNTKFIASPETIFNKHKNKCY